MKDSVPELAMKSCGCSEQHGALLWGWGGLSVKILFCVAQWLRTGAVQTGPKCSLLISQLKIVVSVWEDYCVCVHLYVLLSVSDCVCACLCVCVCYLSVCVLASVCVCVLSECVCASL